MRKAHSMLRVAIVGALAALGALVAAGSASATTLSGAWENFNRCPVNNPLMLSADGDTNIALCLNSDSPNGSFKIGKESATTGDNDLQLGIYLNNPTFNSVAVSPTGGGLVAAPVNVPGGLLGLMCPSGNSAVEKICKSISNSSLNRVVATVQDAGSPSDFQVFAGLSAGQPILTLPVKIHLQNPFLGSSCYIGTHANPIVLHPENVTAPSSFTLLAWDASGNIVDPSDPSAIAGAFYLQGATEGDSTFAVPRASGCGIAGLLDGAINSKVGLPSPSGRNKIVLDNVTTYLGGLLNPNAFYPNDGQELATLWNAAVTG